MELRPLDESHESLLTSLQQQDDVWDFVGSAPLAAYDPDNHAFAIVQDDVGLGFAGLFRTQAAGRDDYEILCATRSEVQHRGVARQACELLLDWALKTARMERVIACIDASNQPARTIARKIGMKEMGSDSSGRIIYAKYRDREGAR
jgi:RimJ/RimL family protein N-acetyltransferase